ncbi:MAG: acyltransferase, partial [Candidatus Eremiobacteraeota bacterium]|nr:acyltransferase [Candidatus Eremiobacteraeota bacterium]
MEERAGSLRYLPQLDGLRALAVAFVLWHHLSRGLWTTAWLAWGWFGVRLFFVLSGFLITRILVRERERVLAEEITRKEALVNFYARRSLRIFPVYYTYVLIDTIIRMVVFHQDCPALGWYLVYVQNFGFAAGLPAVNLHLWTLAVEEQFYWFWPLVVLFLPARHLKRAIVAMI